MRHRYVPTAGLLVEISPEVRVVCVWGVVLQERLVPVRGGARGYDDHAATLWVQVGLVRGDPAVDVDPGDIRVYAYAQRPNVVVEVPPAGHELVAAGEIRRDEREFFRELTEQRRGEPAARVRAQVPVVLHVRPHARASREPKKTFQRLRSKHVVHHQHQRIRRKRLDLHVGPVQCAAADARLVAAREVPVVERREFNLLRHAQRHNLAHVSIGVSQPVNKTRRHTNCPYEHKNKRTNRNSPAPSPAFAPAAVSPPLAGSRRRPARRAQ